MASDVEKIGELIDLKIKNNENQRVVEHQRADLNLVRGEFTEIWLIGPGPPGFPERDTSYAINALRLPEKEPVFYPNTLFVGISAGQIRFRVVE